jgi:hypothetical protein
MKPVIAGPAAITFVKTVLLSWGRAGDKRSSFGNRTDSRFDPAALPVKLTALTKNLGSACRARCLPCRQVDCRLERKLFLREATLFTEGTDVFPRMVR